MRSTTAVEPMCAGKGSWMRMPSIAGSAVSQSLSARSQGSVVDSGRSCEIEAMPF